MLATHLFSKKKKHSGSQVKHGFSDNSALTVKPRLRLPVLCFLRVEDKGETSAQRPTVSPEPLSRWLPVDGVTLDPDSQGPAGPLVLLLVSALTFWG